MKNKLLRLSEILCFSSSALSDHAENKAKCANSEEGATAYSHLSWARGHRALLYHIAHKEQVPGWLQGKMKSAELLHNPLLFSEKIQDVKNCLSNDLCSLFTSCFHFWLGSRCYFPNFSSTSFTDARKMCLWDTHLYVFKQNSLTFRHVHCQNHVKVLEICKIRIKLFPSLWRSSKCSCRL